MESAIPSETPAQFEAKSVRRHPILEHDWCVGTDDTLIYDVIKDIFEFTAIVWICVVPL
jgi:hypothetical protein